MPLEDKGKIIPVGKAGTRYISIPAKVARDSAFPFDDGEEVNVKIIPEKKAIHIEKIK